MAWSDAARAAAAEMRRRKAAGQPWRMRPTKHNLAVLQRPARTDRIGDQHRAQTEALVAKTLAAKASREDTQGFAEQFSPMQRSKIINALNTNRSFGGQLMTIKDGVRSRVLAGAIVGRGKEGRRLQNLNGAYLTEKAITKTGMDYAEFLVGHR